MFGKYGFVKYVSSVIMQHSKNCHRAVYRPNRSFARRARRRIMPPECCGDLVGTKGVEVIGSR